jgi:uncharacterized protein (DUF2336 family)
MRRRRRRRQRGPPRQDPEPRPDPVASSRPDRPGRRAVQLARRELLRGVTDLFFTAENHGDVEMGLFDDVMGQLAGDMEEAVRIELAERLGQAAAPPPA